MAASDGVQAGGGKIVGKLIDCAGKARFPGSSDSRSL
jgi:hypothetical protein